MNLQKLNPWNWFKHEETAPQTDGTVPVVNQAGGHYDNAVTNPVTGLHPISRLQQDIDRLFEQAFQSFGSLGFAPLSAEAERMRRFQPSIDVSGDENSYQITLDVPGLKTSDIVIEVQGDVLCIRGEKEARSESEDQYYYRIERRVGHFQRVLALPDDVVVDEISASLNDGVLKVTMPRNKNALTHDVKRITIH